MKKFIALLSLALFTGCASIGVRDGSLALQITPQPVLRGRPALAEVNASLGAEKVIGTIQVFGSPQLEFRKDDHKGLWYFYGTIPFSPWVKPGNYRVRVMVYEPHQPPHYTEMKVELK